MDIHTHHALRKEPRPRRSRQTARAGAAFLFDRQTAGAGAALEYRDATGHFAAADTPIELAVRKAAMLSFFRGDGKYKTMLRWELIEAPSRPRQPNADGEYDSDVPASGCARKLAIIIFILIAVALIYFVIKGR